MNLKRTTLSIAIGTALGSTSFAASASLTTSAMLTFTLGTAQVVSCNYGTTLPCNKAAYQTTDIVGSYFSFDSNGNGLEATEKTPTSSFNGIHIGVAQSASGSHTGPIDGSENPNINNPWTFFGNTGVHQTTSPITVISDFGLNKTLDFSGWELLWGGLTLTTTAVIPTTIVCDMSSCSDSSNYTIDGTFHIAGAGITTYTYYLHLEGEVSNVPLLPTAWLFGSGLLGLIGIARRKKAA